MSEQETSELIGWLRDMEDTEQSIGDDYSESANAEGWTKANQHWAKAEAYRNVVRHVVRERVLT